MAKIDAEANDIVFAALMKVRDFRVRSVKLYSLDKPGVDSNRTMDKTTIATPVDQRDRHFTSPQCYHEVGVTMIKTLWGPRLASDLQGKEVIEPVAEQLVGFAEASVAASKSAPHGASSRAKTARAPCKKANP